MSDCAKCDNGKRLNVGWKCDVCGRTSWSELSPAHGSTRFLAECHYTQTAPAYSKDANGISWTRNKTDAHRFQSKASAMAVAVAQAISSNGEAQVSNDDLTHGGK